MAASEQGAGEATARAGDLARGPKFLFAVAVIAGLCLLCAPLFVERIDHAAPKPVAGSVDFSAHPVTGPTPLSGEWRLIWRSGAPGPPAGSTQLVALPGRWSENGKGLPGEGAASYRLTMQGVKPGRYVLYVPTIYSASRVVVNGRVLSEEGVVGVSDATTQPTIRAHDVTIDADGGPLDLRLDISSYRQRDNGMEGVPLFGPARAMNRWIALHWLRGILLLTSLLVLACYGLIIFSFRRQDRVWAWFGVACLSMMPVMAVFAHDNLMLLMTPGLSLVAMRAIEYMTVRRDVCARRLPTGCSRAVVQAHRGPSDQILDTRAYAAAIPWRAGSRWWHGSVRVRLGCVSRRLHRGAGDMAAAPGGGLPLGMAMFRRHVTSAYPQRLPAEPAWGWI